MSWGNETDEYYGRIQAENAKAILFEDEWLPKSQIKIVEKGKTPFDVSTIEVPNWLAKEKGLI